MAPTINTICTKRGQGGGEDSCHRTCLQITLPEFLCHPVIQGTVVMLHPACKESGQVHTTLLLVLDKRVMPGQDPQPVVHLIGCIRNPIFPSPQRRAAVPNLFSGWGKKGWFHVSDRHTRNSICTSSGYMRAPFTQVELQTHTCIHPLLAQPSSERVAAW